MATPYRGVQTNYVTVTKTYSSGGEVYHEDEQSEAVQTPKSPDGALVAEITYANGVTMSIGKFEYARIDVGVKLPCAVAEMEDCFKTAMKFVEDKLVAQIKETKEYAAARAKTEG